MVERIKTMFMCIANHGGMCCGIKTIFRLGPDPDNIQPALASDAYKTDVPNRDIRYEYTEQNENLFRGAAPKETSEERLIRYVDFLKENRPSHIIEVVTAESDDPDELQQTSNWGSVLRALGFKEVTSALNSNSFNTVTVWHMVIQDGELVQ